MTEHWQLRSMAATDRNSGHFVQGHVDEAGKILKFTPEGDSLWHLGRHGILSSAQKLSVSSG